MRRAFTTLELMTYSAILLVLMAGVLALFISGKEYYQGAVGSYLVSADFEPGLRVLRQDLKETSLVSIRPYPNSQVTQALPGVSFVSARSYEDNRTFVVSPHGAPQWDKHVFYTFQPKDKSSGSIVRWEQKIDPPSFVPLASTELPQLIKDTSRSRTIFKGVVAPSTRLESIKQDSDSHGGFRVSFLGYDGEEEKLTDTNPALISAGAASEVPAEGISRVIQVDLQGISASDTGHPTYYWLHFRLYPRHS